MKKIMWVLTVLFLSASFAMAGGRPDAAEAAERWPTRPVNMVVAFGAGGNSDMNARAIATHLTAILGQPFVITNVGAAGGTVAAAQVRDAAPDGYTMLVHQISLNVARAAGVIDFTFEDLAPVCVFSRGADSVIAVRADSPWHSIEELIAYSQANPYTIRWAANTGATTHWIAIAAINAGARLNVVAAGGSGERIPLLLGGHMDVIPIPLGMIEDHEAMGTVRILATTSNERPPSRPDIPTMLESGVDVGFEYNNTFFMPRGTSPVIIERLNDAVRQVVQTNRAYQDQVAGFGQVPVWKSTSETVDLFRRELAALMAISDVMRGN